MKLTTFLTTAAFAVTALAQYNITSKPFYLQLHSHDDDFDKTYLFACHEGAAIEGLCVGNTTVDPDHADSYTFRFNTSVYDTPDSFNKTLGQNGIVTWILHGGNFAVSEPLGLYYEPTTNVALPLLTPSDDSSPLMAFDNKGLLNIQGYVDDTVDPAVAGPTKAYYRWYACDTYYLGYRYTSLTWVMGEAEPQNPTCCKVDVKRHYIKAT